jgi:hypothetical protein
MAHPLLTKVSNSKKQNNQDAKTKIGKVDVRHQPKYSHFQKKLITYLTAKKFGLTLFGRTSLE